MKGDDALTVESWFLESLIFSNLLKTRMKSDFPPISWTQTEFYPHATTEITQFLKLISVSFQVSKIGIPLWKIHPLNIYSTIKDVIYGKCYLYTVIDSLN